MALVNNDQANADSPRCHYLNRFIHFVNCVSVCLCVRVTGVAAYSTDRALSEQPRPDLIGSD